MKRLLGKKYVQEVLQLVIDYVHITSEDICDILVEKCDLSVCLDLKIVLEHLCEQYIVALAVSYMIGCSERICHSVNCRAPGISESDSSIVGCDKEILEQVIARFFALVPDLHESAKDHVDSLVAEHLCITVGLRRQR